MIIFSEQLWLQVIILNAYNLLSSIPFKHRAIDPMSRVFANGS